MSYKPIKHLSQTTIPARIQPAPEPEQDEPDVSGRWTAVALKLCGVVAVMASVGMIYLVWICAVGRW